MRSSDAVAGWSPWRSAWSSPWTVGELLWSHDEQQPKRTFGVPRAILYRYLKRIVANLAGIVTVAIEPLQHVDQLDDGLTDMDDD